MSAIAYANATCSVRHNGSVVRLAVGQPWAADDPFVAARPDLFSDEPEFVHRTAATGVVVEQATSAPGERRTTKRAR